jgi:AcrR family transcriptional regulator
MVSVPVERLTPERRRQLTRSALVDAAAEVFAKRGFHAASLDEIAQTAGFTRGAIYSNFDGKEDLLLEVLDMMIGRQLAAFGEALDGRMQESDLQVSAAAAEVWTRTVRQDPNLAALSLELRLYGLRNREFGRRLATAERRQSERIAAFIDDLRRQRDETLRIPAEELAVILSAASVGLSQVAAIDTERGDYYDRVSQMFLTFIAEYIAEPRRERTDD